MATYGEAHKYARKHLNLQTDSEDHAWALTFATSGASIESYTGALKYGHTMHEIT